MASEKVKGLSIKLSADTTAVNSALGTLNKSLGSTQKELNQVDKLLKLDPKNVNLLTQKQGLLSSAINDTKLKLEQLNKVKELADKDDSVDKNSKQYRDLATQVEATKIKLQQYENQQDDVNKSLKEGSSDALSFGDVLKANVVSDVIVGGVKALAKAFADVGKALYNGIRDAGVYADDINTLAKQYNLTTKEIQQFMSASDLIDVEFSTIAKSFTKLTKAMTSNTKDTQKAFKELGISVKDSNGELRSSNDVFYETIEALSKIENETEQDALAMQIFGKSSAELGSLINGGTEQLAEWNKYLEENNLLLSQSQLDGLNDMNDGFDTLNKTIELIKYQLASELAPVITPLLEDIKNYIIDNKDKITEFVKNVVDYLTSDRAKEMYENIKTTIKDVIDGITSFIDDYDTLKSNLNGLLSILKIILAVVNAIVDAISFIISNERYLGDVDDDDYRKITSGGYSSSGFGEYQSGGYGKSMTSNLTINVNTNQTITEQQVRGWANIINQELGGMV